MLNTFNIKGIEGFVTIRDAVTREEFVTNQQNAIHFGNIVPALGYAFLGDDDYFLNTMAFGNDATAITQDGKVFYRSKNVSNIYDPSADLYNQTYQKTLTNLSDATPVQGNNIDTSLSDLGHFDINIVATLDFGEPTGQDMEAVGEDPDAPYMFDEIGMKTDNGLLVSHIVFHPIMKAASRSIEVEYTIRIQMS